MMHMRGVCARHTVWVLGGPTLFFRCARCRAPHLSRSSCVSLGTVLRAKCVARCRKMARPLRVLLVWLTALVAVCDAKFDYQKSEQAAKRRTRARLHLPEPVGIVAVDPKDFGNAEYSKSTDFKQVGCWFETLSTSEITKYFLRNDINPIRANCISEYNETALHYCSRPSDDGDRSVGKQCVQAALRVDGIDLTVRDEIGCTCLTWAVHNGLLENAAMLIQAGADTSVMDDMNRTLLDHATTDKMKELLSKPTEMAATILAHHEPVSAAHYNPSVSSMKSSLHRLSIANWDEEINVKLQVEQKDAVLLFVKESDCTKRCKRAKEVFKGLASHSEMKKILFYIMDGYVDEPPKPFGKQTDFPAIYVRSKQSKQASKCSGEDLDDGELGVKLCIARFLQ